MEAGPKPALVRTAPPRAGWHARRTPPRFPRSAVPARSLLPGNQAVFKRLEKAIKRCETTAQCRESLTRELEKLAKEVKCIGSELNKLVTRTE